MKCKNLIAVVALTTCSSGFEHMASGTSSLVKRDDHPWQPVPPGGVRAPCPGTNTLANHGYINRDGKNITAEAYRKAFFDAFGFGMETLVNGTNNAVNLCSFLTGKTCHSFDLDILATPHQIEHDGSMSRCDKEMKSNPDANNNSFNQTMWDISKAIYSDASRGSTHVDMQVANTVRLRRFQQARKADIPGWFIANNGGTGAEHAFILSVMNDPAKGQNLSDPLAKFAWIDYWISNERLPTDLGWVRPTATIPPLASLNNAIRAQKTIPPKSKRDVASRWDDNKPVVEKKAVEGDLIPLAAVPQIIQTPRGAQAVSEAGAEAVAAAPSLPDTADAYDFVLSVDQFREFGAAAAAHVAKVQLIFQKRLAKLLKDQ